MSYLLFRMVSHQLEKIDDRLDDCFETVASPWFLLGMGIGAIYFWATGKFPQIF